MQTITIPVGDQVFVLDEDQNGWSTVEYQKQIVQFPANYYEKKPLEIDPKTEEQVKTKEIEKNSILFGMFKG